MLSSEYSLVLVSAYGRGQSLAADLRERGLDVTLIDVTEKLGRWSPEDWEGPFGVFQHESWTPLQVARLAEEDFQERLDSGLSIWLGEGPIDTMGPLVGHWADSKTYYSIGRKYIQQFEGLTENQQAIQIDDLSSRAFQDTWLVNLAHQLACHVYVENAFAIEHGRPLPIFSPHSVRRVSRRGYSQSLDWCEQLGIKVHRQAALEDLVTEANACAAVEIQSEHKGAINGQFFVWMLSSEETYKLSSRVGEKLFPQGPVTSMWNWTRFRVQFKLGVYANSLPKHFVAIGDLNLPWVKANLLVVQRALAGEEADVWVRLPNLHRFQRAYLESFSSEIIEFLNKKIPGAETKIVGMPQDYLYEFSELGPSPFPVFDASQLLNLEKLKLKNLYYDGPEVQDNLDWSGRFIVQKDIAAEIWQKVEDLKRKKNKGAKN